jgi:DNA (cytosine-5)-methyltransferase 1
MFECADLANSLDCDIFIMESVIGLWSKGQDIISRLKIYFSGYQFTYLFSDSVIHGSPQIRPRFHFIASRYDFKIARFNPLPVPMIKDAIWDLRLIPEGEMPNHESARVSGQLESLIEAIPCGIRAREIWEMFPDLRDNEYGQPFGPTRRAGWNSPGPTITGGPTIIHPDYDRWLTPREEARIFGYPDLFEFHGRIGNQYAQIGKAVTCFMGEYLGRCARLTLQREQPITRGEKFIDLIPYNERAKILQRTEFFGLNKKEKMENYVG